MSFIYFVKRTVTEEDWDHESYTNFVVFADSEEEARRSHPSGGVFLSEEGDRWLKKNGDSEVEHFWNPWVDAKNIHTLSVTYLGDADPNRNTCGDVKDMRALDREWFFGSNEEADSNGSPWIICRGQDWPLS